MFCELFCSLFISFKHLIGSFEGVYGRLRTVRQGADQRLSALLLARVKPGRECHPSTLIMTKLPGVRSPAQQSSVNAVLPLQAPRLQFYREKCVWTKIDISSNSLVPLTRSHSELFIDYLLRPRSSILHPLPYPLPPLFHLSLSLQVYSSITAITATGLTWTKFKFRNHLSMKTWIVSPYGTRVGREKRLLIFQLQSFRLLGSGILWNLAEAILRICGPEL